MLLSRGFASILRRNGQDAEIRRDGKAVGSAQALPVEQKGYLSFLPDTDIRAGDEVLLLVSEKLFSIQRIEKVADGNVVANLNAHYAGAGGRSQGRQQIVVHGPMISARDITNSAIQSHSPGATQTQTVTGPDSKEKAKEALRLVLEVLKDLDLSPEEKEELKADAESADAQLKSPKTKWQHVKDFFGSIRDQVRKGLTEKVAGNVLEQGQEAVTTLNDTLSSIGG